MSLHSAGIGSPDSVRRYQSRTDSTFASCPDTVIMSAFLTLAAASAATRSSKRAAWGAWAIHQMTRYELFLMPHAPLRSGLSEGRCRIGPAAVPCGATGVRG